MKLRLTTLALSLVIGVFIFVNFFVNTNAFAVTDETAPNSSEQNQPSQTTPPSENNAEDIPTNNQTVQPSSSGKLSDEKLRICLSRSANITDTLQRLVKNSSIQLETIDELSDRTKQFYTDNGQMLTNYSELTNDISAKRAASLATLEPLRVIAVQFNCNNDDPKGELSDFKTGLQKHVDALESYQNSVRMLITDVKTAQTAEEQP